MKRTQPLVVNPRLAQVNEFADHIHDVDGIHNLIDGRSVNHGDKSIKKHGESQIIFAQKSSFVHKRAIFVHFVWLCAQKVVPLHRLFEKGAARTGLHCPCTPFRIHIIYIYIFMALKIVVLAKQVPDTRNVGKDAMTAEGTVA